MVGSLQLGIKNWVQSSIKIVCMEQFHQAQSNMPKWYDIIQELINTGYVISICQ